MELKELQSFLTIIRSGSITGAAHALNISQPALTRQLHLLEEEFGAPLIIRGNRKISLTEKGMILYKRAEELLSLAQKLHEEMTCDNQDIAGQIYIRSSETGGLRFPIQAAKNLMQKYPNINIHITGGDSSDIPYQLDNGLIDFGLVPDPFDSSKYYNIKIPHDAFWGILMRKDSPFADQPSVYLNHFMEQPLIVPSYVHLDEFFHIPVSDFNIVATYNQINHAMILVAEDIGYALCLDDVGCQTTNNALIFRPLCPEARIGMNIIWKKNQIFSKAAQCYLQELYKICHYPV